MLTVCVSELVQQSREFDLVLGRLEPDGCRAPGLIDWFKGLKQTTADIIRYVAADCEVRGNLEDAIHLYDLANVSLHSNGNKYLRYSKGVKPLFEKIRVSCTEI